MPLRNLLCGFHREDVVPEQKCRPVGKGTRKGKKTHNDEKEKKKAKKKNKIKEQALEPGSSVTSPGPDTETQLIACIRDTALRQRFLQLQAERIHEQEERHDKDMQLKRELDETLNDKDKEIHKLRQDLEDVIEQRESTKQELQVTKEEKNRLELIVNTLQDKPYIPHRVHKSLQESTSSKLVEALGKLVVLLPKEKIRQESQFSQEVKDVMRLVEHFIGPRWKEFAREIDLPWDIIEDNKISTDQRQTEIYWSLMSEWQKRENVTVTKIATVCQQLGIDVCSDKPMSGQHKRTLDKNRESLLHDVFPKLALNHMLKYLPIPASLREYVTSAENRYDMAERLLDILPVLGDQAFPVFALALNNTGQQHIAELLIEKPMLEEHKLILRKFENTVIRYSDSHRLISSMAKYVTIPGCIHRYLLESNTRDTKMRRLLEILPCFGHQAMDILTKSLSDTGSKQVSSILKDKTGEVQKLTKIEASTQISPEDVQVLSQEPRAPLTGHRRPAKSRDSPNSSDTTDANNSEELLWQDDHYAHEILTKEMEANAAMTDTSIEQQVNMDYRSPKPIEILKHMDRVRVRYTPRGTELE